jgi:hypothetical protein
MASDHRYYGAVTLYFYLVCHFGQTAPKAPGLPGNKEQYLQNVDNLYITDAYHLLSIERYRVTPELIERVRLGTMEQQRAAWTHYYSDYYYKAFDKISSYAPANINKGLRAIDVLRQPNDGNTVKIIIFLDLNPELL